MFFFNKSVKIIVAGSRDLFIPKDYLNEELNKKFKNITEIVSGGADGIDSCGEAWAREHKVVLTKFEADWKQHGKRAGPIRNEQMSKYADGAIIFVRRGQMTPGSANMVMCMQKQKKPYFVVEV